MDSSIERQRKHFNEISSRYSTARKDPNHLLLKHLIWSNFFEKKRNLAVPRINVLEPMCGTGEGLAIIKRYLQSDIEYLGFDYSEEMVSVARGLFPEEQIEWRDVTTFEGYDGCFDWIVLIGGLHHVFSRTSEVLERLGAALRPGGYFLSFEPTHNCWFTRTIRSGIYQRNRLFDSDTEQGFDLKELDGMFKHVGFEKVDQIFPGLLAYVLYYNPDAFPGLNLGGSWCVRSTFAIDRLLWRTWLAKKFSFATIGLWRRR